MQNLIILFLVAAASVGCTATSMRIIPGGPIEFGDVAFGTDKSMQFDELVAEAGGKTVIKNFKFGTSGQKESFKEANKTVRAVAIVGIVMDSLRGILRAIMPGGVFEGGRVAAEAAAVPK
jgi:hypothetical protein